jgi:hypothetical protein
MTDTVRIGSNEFSALTGFSRDSSSPNMELRVRRNTLSAVPAGHAQAC